MVSKWDHNATMKDPAEKREEVTARFPPELYKALVAEAERLGISNNALLCVALDQWLHQRGKL